MTHRGRFSRRVVSRLFSVEGMCLFAALVFFASVNYYLDPYTRERAQSTVALHRIAKPYDETKFWMRRPPAVSVANKSRGDDEEEEEPVPSRYRLLHMRCELADAVKHSIHAMHVRMGRIPVLFVHGNSGSYDLSSAIASLLPLGRWPPRENKPLRDAATPSLGMTVFSADMNEDASIHSGQVIMRQGRFVLKSAVFLKRRFIAYYLSQGRNRCDSVPVTRALDDTVVADSTSKRNSVDDANATTREDEANAASPSSGSSPDSASAKTKIMTPFCKQLWRELETVEHSGIWLIGHSMGGIVARWAALLSLRRRRRHGRESHYNDDDAGGGVLWKQSMIAGVITLNTPHKYPPIFLDGDMFRVYRDLANAWGSENGERGGGGVSVVGDDADEKRVPPVPPLLSISSGPLDEQVFFETTDLGPGVDPALATSLLTTHMLDCGYLFDHNALLWSLEFVEPFVESFWRIHVQLVESLFPTSVSSLTPSTTEQPLMARDSNVDDAATHQTKDTSLMMDLVDHHKAEVLKRSFLSILDLAATPPPLCSLDKKTTMMSPQIHHLRRHRRRFVVPQLSPLTSFSQTPKNGGGGGLGVVMAMIPVRREELQCISVAWVRRSVSTCETHRVVSSSRPPADDDENDHVSANMVTCPMSKSMLDSGWSLLAVPNVPQDAVEIHVNVEMLVGESDNEESPVPPAEEEEEGSSSNSAAEEPAAAAAAAVVVDTSIFLDPSPDADETDNNAPDEEGGEGGGVLLLDQKKKKEKKRTRGFLLHEASNSLFHRQGYFAFKEDVMNVTARRGDVFLLKIVSAAAEPPPTASSTCCERKDTTLACEEFSTTAAAAGEEPVPPSSSSSALCAVVDARALMESHDDGGLRWSSFVSSIQFLKLYSFEDTIWRPYHNGTYYFFCGTKRATTASTSGSSNQQPTTAQVRAFLLPSMAAVHALPETMLPLSMMSSLALRWVNQMIVAEDGPLMIHIMIVFFFVMVATTATTTTTSAAAPASTTSDSYSSTATASAANVVPAAAGAAAAGGGGVGGVAQGKKIPQKKVSSSSSSSSSFEFVLAVVCCVCRALACVSLDDVVVLSPFEWMGKVSCAVVGCGVGAALLRMCVLFDSILLALQSIAMRSTVCAAALPFGGLSIAALAAAAPLLRPSMSCALTPLVVFFCCGLCFRHRRIRKTLLSTSMLLFIASGGVFHLRNFVLGSALTPLSEEYQVSVHAVLCVCLVASAMECALEVPSNTTPPPPPSSVSHSLHEGNSKCNIAAAVVPSMVVWIFDVSMMRSPLAHVSERYWDSSPMVIGLVFVCLALLMDVLMGHPRLLL